MQFKTLILTLAAVAISVSAQSFDNNTCSQCTFASIPKESTCAALVPVDMQQLQAVFANSSVNVNALATAVQNPAIKNCLCHWSSNTFSATGAAASCAVAQGSTLAACNATQVAEASTRMAPLAMILQCANSTAVNSTGGNSTGGNSNTTTANPSGAGASAASGYSLNMPYVVAMAALGVAAFAGL